MRQILHPSSVVSPFVVAPPSCISTLHKKLLLSPNDVTLVVVPGAGRGISPRPAVLHIISNIKTEFDNLGLHAATNFDGPRLAGLGSRHL